MSGGLVETRRPHAAAQGERPRARGCVCPAVPPLCRLRAFAACQHALTLAAPGGTSRAPQQGLSGGPWASGRRRTAGDPERGVARKVPRAVGDPGVAVAFRRRRAAGTRAAAWPPEAPSSRDPGRRRARRRRAAGTRSGGVGLREAPPPRLAQQGTRSGGRASGRRSRSRGAGARPRACALTRPLPVQVGCKLSLPGVLPVSSASWPTSTGCWWRALTHPAGGHLRPRRRSSCLLIGMG